MDLKDLRIWSYGLDVQQCLHQHTGCGRILKVRLKPRDLRKVLSLWTPRHIWTLTVISRYFSPCMTQVSLYMQNSCEMFTQEEFITLLINLDFQLFKLILMKIMTKKNGFYWTLHFQVARKFKQKIDRHSFFAKTTLSTKLTLMIYLLLSWTAYVEISSFGMLEL